MSHPIRPGAVVFAKDLERMATFYRGVAGFAVVHADKALIVLESASQQLVLHGIPPRIAKTIVIESPPKQRENNAVKLIFPVDRLDEARRVAATLGGALDPVAREFEARGFRACDGHDPEGNVVQFREPAARAPAGGSAVVGR